MTMETNKTDEKFVDMKVKPVIIGLFLSFLFWYFYHLYSTPFMETWNAKISLLYNFYALAFLSICMFLLSFIISNRWFLLIIIFNLFFSEFDLGMGWGGAVDITLGVFILLLLQVLPLFVPNSLKRLIRMKMFPEKYIPAMIVLLIVFSAIACYFSVRIEVTYPDIPGFSQIV
jgi:hypothetical protein